MRLTLACFLALALATPAVFAQDELGPIIEKAKKSLTDTKSWQADLSMKMQMQGMTMEWKGDTVYSGSRSATSMTIDMMGQKMAMKSIVDGDGVSWNEVNMGGMGVQVVKMDAETVQAMQEMSGDTMGLAGGGMGGNVDAVKFIREVLDNFDVALEGRDSVGDTEVYLLGADLPDEMKSGMNQMGMAQMGISLERLRLAFGVEDGFVRQYEMLSADGNPILTMSYTNLELNPDVDDALFEYTPPEGAMVQDFGDALAGMAGAGGGATPGKFEIGSPAPAFTGTSLAGEEVSLADYEGKVVLIDFWATWCSPCIQELPHVIDAYKAYKDKGFEIIAISLDEEREDLETFLKDRPDMTWVQLFDNKGWDADIALAYEVEAIPFTLLVDREGNVVAQDLRGDALANALADLLDE